MTTSDTVRSALALLGKWLEDHDYQAYDPFDGLNSWLRPLARGRLARQALVQVNLRSPINLRPVLGIKPATSTKAMGYIARAYLRLYRATRDQGFLRKANICLEWLRQHTSPDQPGISWGNHFDYQTRAYYLARGGPTVVWTALIGHAFVDAYELLGRDEDLKTASAAAKFIVDGLERRAEGAGLCISYVPGTYVAIHNANMLAAGFLARVWRHTKQEQLRQISRAAVAYSVGAQRPDGSWWYAEDPMFHWVDNWHTAYVLDSLWWYRQSTGDTAFMDRFEAGVRFWLDHFFLSDGTPRFYATRTYPLDIQCAAQSIDTLCLLAEGYDPTLLQLAEKVALWTINRMQDADGHFYFRRTPRWINRTPMLHWGQATTFHGLASFLTLVGQEE